MNIIITNYQNEVINGDWAPAFNKAISDIRTGHNNANPKTNTEGGIITIPRGAYEVKSPVFLSNAIEFIGEGFGSFLKMTETGIFRKKTEEDNNQGDSNNLENTTKYVRFEKLRFQQSPQFQEDCFIDFTRAYLCSIESCYAAGTGANSTFVVLGNEADVGFSHYNNLINCDLLDFSEPFKIGPLSNDHRILYNRFRNFTTQLVPISIPSTHCKFCYNGIESDDFTSHRIIEVSGVSNIVVGNRIESHKPVAVLYGMELSGTGNYVAGNRYLGVTNLMTETGDNNIVLEPGTKDGAGPGIDIPARYKVEQLVIGTDADMIMQGRTIETTLGNLQVNRTSEYNTEFGGKVFAYKGLGIGNSVSGDVTATAKQRKAEVFDQYGNSIGFIQVYAG